MSTRRSFRLAALLAALACVPLAAGERTHRVRSGDSASKLAARYYGDVHLGDLILEYNGRDGTTLHPGEELRIPYAEVLTVRPGDAWSVLAQRALGRAAAYPALASINGMDPDRPLQVGQQIRLPILMPHTLSRGETLGGLAERYCGDGDLVAALQQLNQIEDPRRLSIGQSLMIPLLEPRLLESTEKVAKAAPRSKPPETRAQKRKEPPPDPVASRAPAQPASPPGEATPTAAKGAGSPDDRPEPPPEPVPGRPEEAIPKPRQEPQPGPAENPPVVRRFNQELGAAARAFDDGEYQLALDLLESILPEIAIAADGEERSRHHRLLAYVYIAFDRVEDACGVLGGDIESDLDPDRISPKIRATLSGCGRARP